MTHDGSFEGKFLQGDYYNQGIYNPNRVFDNTEGCASEVIVMANNLLAEDTPDARASHDAEAYLDEDVLMCERHFSYPDSFEQEYGSRPAWRHATVSYYEERSVEESALRIYTIAASVSIGGVHRQMLENRYTLRLSGERGDVADATVEYPDVVYGGVRKRFMTPYDASQAMQFLSSMKTAFESNQHKEV